MHATIRILLRMFVRGLLLGAGVGAAAQHSHINAGARAPAAGSQLFFANRATFEADSGFLIHLVATQSPLYGAIYYGGNDVTFTSLASSPDNGGPSTFAAQPGAHLEVIVETLEGPLGGALSFWDSFDGFFDATEITFTVPVGTIAGLYGFALSENDGSAGADPYGHIHGRKFSVSVPGLYVAGFRVVDTSRNGPGGGPLHLPSELTYFNFQAGVTIAEITSVGDTIRLRYGTEVGRSYFIEASEAIAAVSLWKTVAGPLIGTGRLETAESITVTGAPVFYRLRVE